MSTATKFVVLASLALTACGHTSRLIGEMAVVRDRVIMTAVVTEDRFMGEFVYQDAYVCDLAGATLNCVDLDVTFPPEK